MSESAELGPADLLGCVCFNARSAARAITQFYDRALAPTGLRITQLAILGMIRSEGSVTMQALAKHLQLDPSTLTRTLQPLEREGLLRIEAGEDRRVREVVLTAAGYRQVARGAERWRAAQDTVRARIGAERFTRIVDDLNALMAALSAPRET